MKLEHADKVILDNVNKYQNIKWVNAMLNSKSLLEEDMSQYLEKTKMMKINYIFFWKEWKMESIELFMEVY